jgi:Na+-transporting NADH:ubiquinone oxidoreductase subunit NqrE
MEGFSMINFIYQHIHSTIAAIIGASSTMMLPTYDFISKIIIGLIVGVGTWIITKTLSYIFNKLRNKC